MGGILTQEDKCLVFGCQRYPKTCPNPSENDDFKTHKSHTQDLGPLDKDEKESKRTLETTCWFLRMVAVKLGTRYIFCCLTGTYEDGRGEKRFKGLPGLKESQHGPQLKNQYVMPFPPMPRTYPTGFGVGLQQAMESWYPQPHIRQKRAVDLGMSDKELFCSLPLGDLWKDADLVACYRYFRNSDKVSIPASWETVFEDLDSELNKMCPIET